MQLANITGGEAVAGIAGAEAFARMEGVRGNASVVT